MSHVTSELHPGAMHEYQCLCSRKTKILKRWTNIRLKIMQGTTSFRVLDNYEDKIEELFDVSNISSIIVKVIGDDPHDLEKFLGVKVKYKYGSVKTTFRMKDIVQQRWLMASLGAVGRGLYSPVLGVEEKEMELRWAGIWDITHAVEPLQTAENISKALLSQAADPSKELTPPQYTEDKVNKYTQEPSCKLQQEMKELTFAQLTSLQDGEAISNRDQHDMFLPPLGPPVHVLINIGFGTEVNLQQGIQELWDSLTKCSLYIDHNQQQTYDQDPRPPRHPDPIIECKQIVYGPDRKEVTLPQVDQTPNAISYHTDRAIRNKEKWGAWIMAQGIDGVNGPQGINGKTGNNGSSGRDGGSLFSKSGAKGGYGGHGHPGTNGSNGMHGTNGSDLLLFLSGNAENLEISDCIQEVVNIGDETREHCLFVDCSGGRGGHGGSGGRGGDGGSGGNGGRGGTGGYGGSGERGGEGGRGGNGGTGGRGENGARGGDAGNSGNGGYCAIQTCDPRLLHLVEVAVNSGAPGIGGHPGLGGKGGEGGHGGRGGFGGRGHPPGPTGKSGPHGNKGTRGRYGDPGNNGIRGVNGGLLFVLLSLDRQSVIEQSAYIFEVKVDPTSLVITSAVNDGIFEPNEPITVTGFTLVNIGKMTLPEGALVSMVPTATVKFQPTKFELPSLKEQQTLTITQEYHGRVYDVPPPNTQGPYLGEAYFETRVDLLGRPFESSKTVHKLIVQYPVKINEIELPENLGRGEQGLINITLKNISTLPYGNCDGSGGKLALRIHFDKRLSPCANASSSTFYRIHYDPNILDSFYVDIDRVDSNMTLLIEFNVAMSNKAELFDRCPIQIDLLLRDKLIEYQQESIRVIPFYIPSNPPADILFVTDRSITRKEFVLWQRLFELLGTRVDFWDKDRYEGFSYKGQTGERHQMTWIGRHSGSLILIPNDPFELIDPMDVYTHLTDDSRIENDINSLFGDGAVLLIDKPHNHDLRKIKNFIRPICLQGQKFALEGKDFGGNHLLNPDEEDIMERKSSIIQNLEAHPPVNRCYITNEITNSQRLNLLSFTYGSLEIHRIPLEPSSKFTIVTRDITRFISDDEQLSVGQIEIPLSNNWSQTLLHILYGLPTHLKFAMLQGHRNLEINAAFITPAGLKLEVIDLVQLVLTKEIIAEIKCLTLRLTKLAALTARVLGDLDSFLNNATQVFAIITAVKIFAKENISRKEKEVKLKVLDYCRPIKRKLIALGGKPTRELFQHIKSFSVKEKSIHFENLIDSDNTFEPHICNQNDLNNELISIQ